MIPESMRTVSIHAVKMGPIVVEPIRIGHIVFIESLKIGPVVAERMATGPMIIEPIRMRPFVPERAGP